MKKFLPNWIANPTTVYRLPSVAEDGRRKTEDITKNGFTLIELMVVVTIIAFLSVIGIVSFTNVQAQARDGRRRADIDAIATALETNRTGAPGSEVYPSYAGSIFANGQQLYDPVDTTKTGSAVSYGGASYQYVVTVVTTTPSSFVACALLEKGNGNAAAGGASGTTHYCRKNQQ